jgi:hypothetical protein
VQKWYLFHENDLRVCAKQYLFCIKYIRHKDIIYSIYHAFSLIYLYSSSQSSWLDPGPTRLWTWMYW